MPAVSFVHLRLKSEFTVSSSTIRLEEVLEVAKHDSQPALALTDEDNLFGLVKFYDACRAFGIKPIVGCDVSLESESGEDCSVILLVKNCSGYRNLCDLLTAAWFRSKADGKAQVRKEWLVSSQRGDLIILSGAGNGDVGKAISQGNMSEAARLLEDWTRRFPCDYYIEIQRPDHLVSLPTDGRLLDLAAAFGVPVVATHPIQFLRKADYDAHEVRSCIFDGKAVTDSRRERKFSTHQHFKSQKEMAELFGDIPTALSNAVEIARRCNFIWKLNQPAMPQFPIQEGMSLRDCFLGSLLSGLKRHLQSGSLKLDSSCYWHYKVRLMSECQVIVSMSFLDYFMVVSDFVAWSKLRPITVGPGRGSGAGSLVAFALNITGIDPIRFGLLFERFLNPDRISLPDLDIDFCQERRDQVIFFVREKYGNNRTSQITTFGTLSTKAAIRDVGRALGLNFSLVDSVAKLIPVRPNLSLSIAEALTGEPLLLRKCEEDGNVRKLISLAMRIEGLTKNVAVHAGGVLIAPMPVTNYCPLYSQPDAPTSLVSQFDKDGLERIGLTKFDFLGLTTLTILDATSQHVQSLHHTKNWTLGCASSRDVTTFRLLQEADTVAVFQLESPGMREVLRMAKPDKMSDVIALIALYRPGPMKLINSFFRRKHGQEEVTVPSILLQPILEETYGIMVYQEQVMKIAQTLGGYTLSEADILRRAISRKQTKEMAKQRVIFNSRTERLGIDFDQSDATFQLMEKFACYGFNKSHAAAYTLLTYRTAWLKAHFPTEFLASNFSYSMSDYDRMKVLHTDCKKRDIVLQQPNINVSDYQFSPCQASSTQDVSTISYGLGAIKGSGKCAVREILRTRDNRPFSSILDFCLRVSHRTVSRKLVESLIKAGAFESLHGPDCRGSLLKLLPSVLKYSTNLRTSKSGDIIPFVRLNAIRLGELIGKTDPLLTKKKVLREERKVLGFYLSRHPFQYYRAELTKLFPTSIGLTKRAVTSDAVTTVCGIVVSASPKSIKGVPTVKLVIEDDGDQCLVLLEEVQLKCKLSRDRLVVATGKATISPSDEKMILTANSISSLGQVRHQHCRSLRFQCTKRDDVPKVRSHLQHLSSIVGRLLEVQIWVSDSSSVSCFHRFTCSLLRVVISTKRVVGDAKVSYSY